MTPDTSITLADLFTWLTTALAGGALCVTAWQLFKVLLKDSDQGQAAKTEDKAKNYMGVLANGGMFIAAIYAIKIVVGAISGSITSMLLV